MSTENQSRPELSVVILCYKAGDFVRSFVSLMKKTLEENGIDSHELVLVANYNKHEHDSDTTHLVVKKIAEGDPKVRPVIKVKEGMMGWDMRSGLDAATGEHIAIIDGDGQMPPKDIVRIYRALRAGNHDMAKTYREQRHDGIWRVLISRVYNLLLKTLFPRVRVRDANSKPKIFKREALEKLKLTSDDWFIDAEIIIQSSHLNFSIKEIDTVFFINDQRPSFIKIKAILEFIKNLIFYRFRDLSHLGK